MIKGSVLSSQSWNKCFYNVSINAYLNDSRLSIALMLYYSTLHSDGTTDEKAWSLYVLSLVFGIWKWNLSANLKLWPGWCSVMRSERYARVCSWRHLWVGVNILNSVLLTMGSQWRECNIGVMCSNCLVCVRIIAAVFWRHCSW